jgi:hypothetical protein
VRRGPHDLAEPVAAPHLENLHFVYKSRGLNLLDVTWAAAPH